jgi:hypothetical protein
MYPEAAILQSSSPYPAVIAAQPPVGSTLPSRLRGNDEPGNASLTPA